MGKKCDAKVWGSYSFHILTRFWSAMWDLWILKLSSCKNWSHWSSGYELQIMGNFRAFCCTFSSCFLQSSYGIQWESQYDIDWGCPITSEWPWPPSTSHRWLYCLNKKTINNEAVMRIKNQKLYVYYSIYGSKTNRSILKQNHFWKFLPTSSCPCPTSSSHIPKSASSISTPNLQLSE